MKDKYNKKYKQSKSKNTKHKRIYNVEFNSINHKFIIL